MKVVKWIKRGQNIACHVIWKPSECISRALLDLSDKALFSWSRPRRYVLNLDVIANLGIFHFSRYESMYRTPRHII